MHTYYLTYHIQLWGHHEIHPNIDKSLCYIVHWHHSLGCKLMVVVVLDIDLKKLIQLLLSCQCLCLFPHLAASLLAT